MRNNKNTVLFTFVGFTKNEGKIRKICEIELVLVRERERERERESTEKSRFPKTNLSKKVLIILYKTICMSSHRLDKRIEEEKSKKEKIKWRQ